MSLACSMIARLAPGEARKTEKGQITNGSNPSMAEEVIVNVFADLVSVLASCRLLAC
jgi:hypothetical protein